MHVLNKKYLDELYKSPELLGWAFWVITLKNNGMIVGDAGFKGIPDVKGEVEIGYCMTPSYRSRGYATEAVRGLIQWAFSHKTVKKIKAECLIENTKSMGVLEKVGMKVINRDENFIYWELGRG